MRFRLATSKQLDPITEHLIGDTTCDECIQTVISRTVVKSTVAISRVVNTNNTMTTLNNFTQTHNDNDEETSL